MINIVVLTGAGISAESGLKTFRDSDGLWENYKIEDVATPFAFAKNPELVLRFYNERRKQILNTEPNNAHFELAELQNKKTDSGKIINVQIITQNIDDLHERAGSKNIIHLHGEILKSRSSNKPDLVYDCKEDILLGQKAEDSSQLRPYIVWFHEDVPLINEAYRITSKADVLIVVGTSLNVYPAAGAIQYANPIIPKYIIDPKIPVTHGINNLILFETTASIGVKNAISHILKNL
jgi:NAD-dependent deacetylase